MIGVSSCLAGVNCTYKGSNHLIDKVKELVNDGKAITICPEVLGGLNVPRPPCEIVNKDRGSVESIDGNDFTKEFHLGAKRTLEILKKHHIKVVLLKSKSPSCGKGKIYDGTFSNKIIKGDGINTKLLEENGILVYNEDRIDEFFKFIEKG